MLSYIKIFHAINDYNCQLLVLDIIDNNAFNSIFVKNVLRKKVSNTNI